MKRIIENIVFYLFFVFHPRALVKILRDYQGLFTGVSKQIAETSKELARLYQTLHDGHDPQADGDDEPSESFSEPLVDAAGGKEAGL